MTQPLADVRILVADDQEDVARTLCSPLRRAKARLHFVTDGQAALQALASNSFDLVLLDMKMPPDEWGGVWLLQQLQASGSRTPTLVLSGEGAKQQVIQAMRLGATDWIDKADTDKELLDRTITILAQHHQQALSAGSEQLPTPVASRLARYLRTTDPDKQLTEGLHTLEAVLRLAALIGLASTPPFALPGITLDRLAAPSMGTWLTLCTALANSPAPSGSFQRLFACLAPDSQGRQAIQEFVTIRNQLAHGSTTARRADLDRLDTLLRRFAHRAVSSGVGEIAVATAMTYDGESYAVDVLTFHGTGKPSPNTVSAKNPPVNGSVLLLHKDAEPISLTPLMVSTVAESSGSMHILQFDGLQRSKSAPSPSAALKFARAHVGEEGSVGTFPTPTWPALAAWTGRT
ncbi:PleD family two-component system response regulator [Kitasatospora purpeofusca]|uniref:response regulator n=1 Tax=Kitasatospora purpeofusca TaxID=67352 RepID=UPI00365AB6CC